jgi:hypothetical protein
VDQGQLAIFLIVAGAALLNFVGNCLARCHPSHVKL